MPTPRGQKLVNVIVTNGSAGEVVKVTNLTAGGTTTGILNSSGETVVGGGDTAVDWAEGDILSVEIQGRICQSSSATIADGGVKVSLGSAASSNSATVNL